MTPVDDVGWRACLDDLAAVADRLGERIAAGPEPERDADVAVKLFGAVMGAYLTHLWAEPDHTAFLPSVGYHQMYGTPNPDTIYRSAAIDGRGEYRIIGRRGTVPEVTIMPFGGPTAEGLQTFAPFDLDSLAVGDDGAFEVVLRADRPAGAGDWWPLDPAMRTLMLRSVSDRWGEHEEPRVAIVRLDVDPRRGRFDPDSLRRRFRSFATVVEGMVLSGVARAAALRTDGVVNQLVLADYSANGGLDDQWYHEGCFDLADGEVLLLESRLTPEVRAFSLSLTDPWFSTIDWANAQSSLNRAQAVVDDDGVLRVVIAVDDPGVHNWLDTTGHRSGVVQCRWSGGTRPPEVVVRVVPAVTLDDVPQARVAAAQRAAAIRARQVGVQLRSRW